ncbi:SDR family NAD(P)-dependent oxidoreductase [Pedobacter cryoconitis]|uniref:Short-chain dehydrogenase n=1 Tax=Pedobacter cryoconitis TaxID=188932 RepID=A0A327SUH7_9SPHI|nr:SDR family oxidoreductase [Pedobacter cryoconitis]RAJ29267.1 hypothetical protein LY11_02972 [Pedobacter cryoconitis]
MKATLITGASGGIGEAIAVRLAERKHDLLLVARNAEKLEKLCTRLSEQFGIETQFIAGDLSKASTAADIFAQTQHRGLEIEMLINNAGIGSGGEFTEIPLQSELDMLQLNVSSLVALTHLFLPQMQQRKSGTILNVGSMASFLPVPYMATYAASKAFIRFFTQAITEECKPYNIHVLLLSPGLTKTKFNFSAGIENEKGKALNTDSVSAQTAEQVADEALKALDQRKHVVVSGTINRIGAKLLTLIPNVFLARMFARSYRKKLN